MQSAAAGVWAASGGLRAVGATSTGSHFQGNQPLQWRPEQTTASMHSALHCTGSSQPAQSQCCTAATFWCFLPLSRLHNWDRCSSSPLPRLSCHCPYPPPACRCAVTPPGHKTTINGATGVTEECPAGTYREEWKPATAAGSCNACGDNIDSTATEELTSYAITPDATPTKLYVRASASSCCEYTEGLGLRREQRGSLRH